MGRSSELLLAALFALLTGGVLLSGVAEAVLRAKAGGPAGSAGLSEDGE